MPQETYDLRLSLIQLQPEEERAHAAVALQIERGDTLLNDMRWEQWYDHFHFVVLQQVDRTFESYVRTGLSFNLQAAALYTLVSATVVPAIRHWWCLLPAAMWVTLLLADTYRLAASFTDKWSTLTAQLRYLSDDDR